MAMTMTQKILAAHAGLDEVRAGQLIKAKLDMVLGNDITSPVAINEFNKAGFDGIFHGKNLCGFFPCCTSLSEFIEFYDTIIQSAAKMSIYFNGKI